MILNLQLHPKYPGLGFFFFYKDTETVSMGPEVTEQISR